MATQQPYIPNNYGVFRPSFLHRPSVKHRMMYNAQYHLAVAVEQTSCSGVDSWLFLRRDVDRPMPRTPYSVHITGVGNCRTEHGVGQCYVTIPGIVPLIHHLSWRSPYLALPEFPCAVFVEGCFHTELGLISLSLRCLKWICQHFVRIHTPSIDPSMSEIRILFIPHVVPVVVIVQPWGMRGQWSSALKPAVDPGKPKIVRGAFVNWDLLRYTLEYICNRDSV